MNKLIAITVVAFGLFLGAGKAAFASGLWVEVDIKPQSCPNPINTRSKGVVPVAILGSETFDVRDIDIASVALENAVPIRSAYEDVSTAGTGSCTTLGSDGYPDLILKFTTADLILSCPTTSGPETIWIAGHLLDGTPFAGSDDVIVLCKPD
jgi:hypothetical protein